MSLLQAFILGIVQGLTEFLPVSSSAHLVLTPYLLGWEINPEVTFVFDVLVQIGTLAAVIVYYLNDLWSITKGFLNGLRQRQPFRSAESRLGWFILLATIPAGIAGLLVKDLVEAAFNSPVATASFLFVTCGLLCIAEVVGKNSRGLEKLTWKDALWVGVFQAVAIFPGVSRSGSTISGGMTRHLDRSSAARFSFLMSIPIMLAAGALAAMDLLKLPNLTYHVPMIGVGFATSLVIGYLSIRWLLRFLQRHSLYWFAGYCALIAGIALAVHLAGIR